MTIRKAASEMIGETEEQIRVLYKEREATMTVEDKAMRLTEKLDDFADVFDHYEYADSVQFHMKICYIGRFGCSALVSLPVFCVLYHYFLTLSSGKVK